MTKADSRRAARKFRCKANIIFKEEEHNMNKKGSRKRFTAWLIACAMLITMMPLAAFAEDGGDFNVVGALGETVTEGTDYSYSNGTLTITTATPVAVSMKSGVTETDNIIVIDAKEHEANVTLHNVDIKTTKSNAVELKNTYGVVEKKVTLDIMGTTSLEAKSSGIQANKAPLNLTTTNNGMLNIRNSGVGIADYSGAKVPHPLEINSNLKLNITDCGSNGIFYQSSGVEISGSPVIIIDNSRSEGRSQYAINGNGINISGGTIVLCNNKNSSNASFVMRSAGQQELNIKGDADVTIESGLSGVQVPNALVNVSENAKLKIKNTKRNPLTCGGLTVSDSALVDIASGENGISATKENSKISNNAQLFVTVNTSVSRDLFDFGKTLDITDKAVVNLETVSGSGIEGFKGGIPIADSKLNISGNAKVSVKGTNNAINTNLNMSGNSELTVSDSKNGVEYTRKAVFEGNATAEMTTTDKCPIPGDVTVKPDAEKAYLIKSGATKEDAASNYYAQEQKIPKLSSNDRYFYAASADLKDVTIIGFDKVMKYDGNTVDVSQLFHIDENAGEASYSIVNNTGTGVGVGTIAGNMLTVTKAGKFTIKVNTAAKGVYRAGSETAVLLVQKGAAPRIYFEPASDIIYGDSLAKATFPTNPHGVFKWEDETTVPDGIGSKSYKVKFIPNDTDLYEYTQTLTGDVIVQVKPRPVEIKWTMPESLVYDGYEKTVRAEIANAVSGDTVNFETEGERQPINVGTYTVRVVSVDNGNYTLDGGINLEKQFTIEAKTLNADNITAIADETYTKEEIKPVIEVKDGDKVLTLDTDYKVTYEDNINAGTAKVNVEFIGNYQGATQKSFEILPKTIDSNIELAAPVRNEAPQTSIETDEYTAAVVWSPEVTDYFAYSTVYTAAITIVPKANYTVDGIAENGYVFVNAEKVENAANSGNVTVVYPATGRRSGGGSSSNRYTVYFVTNGGSEVSSQNVARNSVLQEPKAPTKDGFYFAGWYTDKALKNKYDFSEKVTSGLVLYAAWTEKDNAENQFILTIGEKDANVFGTIKTNDVAPKIVKDRTMLPARFVAENLGAKVDWDEKDELVTITGKNLKTGEDVTILIYIDSDIAYVNQKEVKLDSPAFIENDRTYTPIRFISEELGADVTWVESEQKVIITK